MEGILEAVTLPYLTIGEAAKQTNRSPSTIRRIIRSIIVGPSNEDRSGVEPTPKAVEAFKKKGENFTWRIREDVLLKNMSSALKGEEKSAARFSSKMEKDVLQILRQELDRKNMQIEKQWDVIQSLNDRLREGNILMGSLQQRLALPTADSHAPAAVSPPSMEPSIETKRASKRKAQDVKEKLSRKASMEAVTKPSRRGVLSWLFR
ncbi:hypothetical protein HYW84_01920 [Candidatus Peregrinibacteria bacterium]|nr:hypothetical protein [Candidatus Peregrinibacteria bacterium]